MKNYTGSILLIVALLGISLSSYSATVKPQSSFGVATDVRVGTMVTPDGKKVDLVAARNAKGDIFVGQASYEPDGTHYRTDSVFDSRARSRTNGATSSGTFKATIEQKVGKRPVTDAILDKARTAGKSLGKGAATLGRTAVKRHPWGLAFALALEGLAGSDFFWDDEKGDFVKEKDDNTYIVFAQNNRLEIPRNPLDENLYKEYCSREAYNGKPMGCHFLGYAKSQDEGWDKALNHCKTIDFKDNIQSVKGDSIGDLSTCSAQGGFWTSDIRVHVVKWVDYIPITPDEFFDESEPDADKNPNEWVETSGVKPTDDPSVSVPAGTVAQTNPYTDPQDGKTKQTRWDFEPNGRVRETVIPRPDLVPDSPEAPRLDPPSEEDTPNGDKDKDKDGENEKDKEKSETEDLCEKNPDIMACDKQPEKPDEQDFEIEHETVNLFFAPDTIFPTTGTCPAPVSFRVDIPFSGAKTFEFDTAPACEIARRLRDLLIAIAWLVTAVFCFRSFSLKG